MTLKNGSTSGCSQIIDPAIAETNVSQRAQAISKANDLYNELNGRKNVDESTKKSC